MKNKSNVRVYEFYGGYTCITCKYDGNCDRILDYYKYNLFTLVKTGYPYRITFSPVFTIELCSNYRVVNEL